MADTDLVTVTDAWHQIADGTAEMTVQVISGLVWMRVSDSEPPAGAKGHFIRGTVYFAVGDVGWIRSVSPNESAVVAFT